MVKLVDIGQYGSLSFDDDATDAEIKTYIDDNYKEISNRLNIPPEPVGLLQKCYRSILLNVVFVMPRLLLICCS